MQNFLGASACAALVVWFSAVAPGGRALAGPVDATTLDGKMIMGYQGWFGCPGDGSGRGWIHWKDGQQQATIDLLPDVSELDPSELCDSGWVGRNGKPVKLFSDQNPKTVDRHFAWMETYGLDGVALQKFATTLLKPEFVKASDNVLINVRTGAERHGRVYFLMYDLSGMPPEKLALVVEDWRRLIAEGATHDRGYLWHRGRPVLGLWGIGFAGREPTPQAADALLRQLRVASAAAGGVTILGGVPTWWRDRRGDASPDPGWAEFWPKLDVISPWTVGRYTDDAGADKYRNTGLLPDLARARALGADYMPVIFPGFTWSNLMRARHEDAKAIPNQIPRRCGTFYAHQVANAIGAGARMIYTAMFDEVDEGTAMFKLAAQAAESPNSPAFVTLDADGCYAGNDLYLRLAAEVGKTLRGSRSYVEPSLSGQSR
jgi:hypothetical protein